MRVRAPGKVNLWLAVGPLRRDGFHDIATVFHAVSLADDVTASEGTPGSGIGVRTDGEGADAVPSGPENLAYRAVQLLAGRLGQPADIDLLIAKSIPVAGGMAGGSADAAAALLAVSELWHQPVDLASLSAVAAQLGSDVPFALVGGTAVGTGRGEQLAPVLARGEFHWVLALAHTSLSTPQVYAELDRLREASGRESPAPEIPAQLMAALREGDAREVGRHLGNDLQEAAISLRPELAVVLESGLDLGALGGIVSGSGPTCAFLATDREHALDLAAGLTSVPRVRSVRYATGPAAGARVVRDDVVRGS